MPYSDILQRIMDIRAVDRLKRIGYGQAAMLELALQAVPENQRKQYLEKLFRELGKACLDARSKSEPPLDGVYYLHDVDLRHLELTKNPETLAAIIMETMQPYYTAQNKTNFFAGLNSHPGLNSPYKSGTWKPKLWDPETQTWTSADS
jgi:hypothetical protein